MRDYPNMSYVMFENTAGAMEQIINALQAVNGDWRRLDLNRYERPNVEKLAQLCQEFLDAYENYDPNAPRSR